MTTGELIRHHREQRNMTQAELARRTGISPRLMYGYEKGENVPGLANLVKIAEALETPASDLLRGFGGQK